MLIILFFLSLPLFHTFPFFFSFSSLSSILPSSFTFISPYSPPPFTLFKPFFIFYPHTLLVYISCLFFFTLNFLVFSLYSSSILLFLILGLLLTYIIFKPFHTLIIGFY